MKSLTYLLVILLIMQSCSVEPENINYGKEACNFCKMTIVDPQHASEAVTAKGKVYKYDAIECMINSLKQKTNVEIGLLFVNDYSTPGTLIDAKTATFLISKEIKSPMGAFLSAFENKKEAQKILEKHGGLIFNWDTIQKEIK